MPISSSISMIDSHGSDDEGRVYGFFMTGQAVFVSIVFCANFKLFSFSHSYSVLYVITIALSACLGYFVWWLVNLLDLGSLEHTFMR